MIVRDGINIRDKSSMKIVYNRMKSGPKGTRIILKDHYTGKVLSDNHNKIVISGAQFTAATQWGIEYSVDFPTYNEEFSLENTLDYSTIDEPYNTPIICLWCAGQGGCGTTPTDTYPVKYASRIEPDDMIPFRYLDADSDLNEDMRDVYFGRYTDDDGMIRYMFKKFDTEPQLHLRYLDGTQITESVYSIDSEQEAECYVETRLRITRLDFRDYFEQVLGWDSALVNTISLCYAWYDDTVDDYVWYQQILPFSKLNFPTEMLTDLSKAIDIIYQVYY